MESMLPLHARVSVRGPDGRERPATVVLVAGAKYVVSYDDRREREWIGPDRMIGPRETTASASAGLFVADLAASLFLPKDAARVAAAHLDFTVPPTERAGPFSMFDAVWAQAEDRRWYRAKIDKKTGTNSFLVHWEGEGFTPSYLDARYLRRL
jgi:hypothetical protein